uniref:Uncharacterized protein n=1 Tax=Neobodo designis TaxID=312471 RepID=A0A7S1PPE7_NEODS|mmetsp:Transcript_15958/g.49476  ORF Transcript_15958/g.49476 Transcript_15958/m.49476 type:complete len:218 (+) Transcript_15958:714-1367(+)
MAIAVDNTSCCRVHHLVRVQGRQLTQSKEAFAVTARDYVVFYIRRVSAERHRLCVEVLRSQLCVDATFVMSTAITAWGIPKVMPHVLSPGNYVGASHTESGATPKGLSWEALTTHCRDVEDDGRSWILTIGNMRVNESDDCGHEWASHSYTVSHPEFGHVTCADCRGDPEQTQPFEVKGDKDAARKAVAEIAAHEGVTAAEVLAQLGMFGSIVARFL